MIFFTGSYPYGGPWKLDDFDYIYIRSIFVDYFFFYCYRFLNSISTAKTAGSASAAEFAAL